MSTGAFARSCSAFNAATCRRPSPSTSGVRQPTACPISDFCLQRRNEIWLIVKNFPALALLRHAPRLAFHALTLAIVTARQGRGRVFWSAVADGVAGLPGALRKRRAIQRSRQGRAGRARAGDHAAGTRCRPPGRARIRRRAVASAPAVSEMMRPILYMPARSTFGAIRDPARHRPKGTAGRVAVRAADRPPGHHQPITTWLLICCSLQPPEPTATSAHDPLPRNAFVVDGGRGAPSASRRGAGSGSSRSRCRIHASCASTSASASLQRPCWRSDASKARNRRPLRASGRGDGRRRPDRERREDDRPVRIHGSRPRRHAR